MTFRDNPAFGLSDALMLLAVVMWGINFSLIKIALRELTPGGFNGLRLLVTAVIFLVLLALSGEGFVCRYRGPGKIYLQTRQLGGFAQQLIPFLPKPNSGN